MKYILIIVLSLNFSDLFGQNLSKNFIVLDTIYNNIHYSKKIFLDTNLWSIDVNSKGNFWTFKADTLDLEVGIYFLPKHEEIKSKKVNKKIQLDEYVNLILDIYLDDIKESNEKDSTVSCKFSYDFKNQLLIAEYDLLNNPRVIVNCIFINDDGVMLNVVFNGDASNQDKFDEYIRLFIKNNIINPSNELKDSWFLKGTNR